MSEEEKKAIEYLENRLDILHNNTQWATEKSIKVVLNLLNKQQKEIEEYQKCFEDIERHQKNQMQMQKNLWKRLKGEINE